MGRVKLNVYLRENAKSGQYYVALEKGKQQVYCDMDTDNGGWTLFFNYVHFPGSEMTLNQNSFPTSLKGNSHMYLHTAGFSDRDVKEVRFLCSEKTKSGRVFWHFKSVSDGIIQTALTGDQNNMRKTDFVSSYIEMPKPSFFRGNDYKRSFSKSSVNALNVIGKNRNGGFTHTPFGSDTYNSYWTVSGDNMNRYECGSNHQDTGAVVAPDESPGMVYTHHTIWFRGEPPTEDYVRDRQMNKHTGDT